MTELLEMKLRKKNVSTEEVTSINSSINPIYKTIAKYGLYCMDPMKHHEILEKFSDDITHPSELLLISAELEKIKSNDYNTTLKNSYASTNILSFFYEKLVKKGHTDFLLDVDIRMEDFGSRTNVEFMNVETFFEVAKTNSDIINNDFVNRVVQNYENCNVVFKQGCSHAPSGKSCTFDIYPMNHDMGTHITVANCLRGSGSSVYNMYTEENYNIMIHSGGRREHDPSLSVDFNTINLIKNGKVKKTAKRYPWKEI
ncbi:MAG TPA: hypothetical protein VEC16_02295 [Alphaproteobacteria bacterium]|nr:hypothetical protein [Alphaproteobacteria bacterium]